MNSQKSKLSLLNSIEEVIIRTLQCEIPNVTVQNHIQSNNIRLLNGIIATDHDDSITRCIYFVSMKSRTTFAVIFHLLAKIYVMLLKNYCFTRRELYYQEIHIIHCQKITDRAVQIICCLLQCSPWELGIVASSKGLVAGPLRIKLNSENLIDCSSSVGTLIPHQVSSSETELRTTAQYVLLVEKDAIFQTLLNENILEKLQGSLLVTGKGYPDVNTRILIKKLNENLKLPVFALMDGDPYGIAIMCVYRFGSKNMSNYSSSLVTPNLKWLGVHPSDFKIYKTMSTLPLLEHDTKILQITANKIISHENFDLFKQVQKFFKIGKKAEIEALCKFSTNFLTDVYIPNKLLTNQFY